VARGGNKDAASGRRRSPWTTGSYWQDVVLVQVALAEHDLKHVRAYVEGEGGAPSTVVVDGMDDVCQLLRQSRQAAEGGCRRGQLWNGRPISHAFTNLHYAEVLIAKHAPENELDERLVPAMARMRATLGWQEPRRRALERRLRALRRTEDHQKAAPDSDIHAAAVKRTVLTSAIEWAYSARDAQYARLRGFRNVVWIVTVALLVLAVGLVVFGAVWPDALELCFEAPEGTGQVCPTGSEPHRIDALVISLLGATGGAISAVIAITRMQGSQTPFEVPLALALLKPPFGAVTALAGLILIHGQFVPGLTNLDSEGQILAYALFFGIVQQILTGFVDRRADDLLEQVPHKRGPDAGTPSPSEAISDIADLVEPDGSDATSSQGTGKA
jgi:hypothetical protein